MTELQIFAALLSLTCTSYSSFYTYGIQKCSMQKHFAQEFKVTKVFVTLELKGNFIPNNLIKAKSSIKERLEQVMADLLRIKDFFSQLLCTSSFDRYLSRKQP